MKKLIFTLVVVLGLSTAAVAASQSGWIGTDWIVSGTLIQSETLKSNLDWLEENKVHKPQDCTGETQRLTWKDGVWICEEFIIPTVPTENLPRNCIFNGNTVEHDSSVSAYQTGSVSYGQSCSQQTRTCTDGTLSGSFTNSSCTVGGPASCSFAGGSVAHGQSVSSYETSSVAYGESCNQQVRTCTDGTLSGSFVNSSCAVNPGTACSFAGNSVPHNSSLTAYQAESVVAPNSCVSENRTCTDGVLGGTFTHTSCTVGGGGSPDPVVTDCRTCLQWSIQNGCTEPELLTCSTSQRCEPYDPTLIGLSGEERPTSLGRCVPR